MSMGEKSVKRVVAFLLALVMIFTTIHYSYVDAATMEKESETTTEKKDDKVVASSITTKTIKGSVTFGDDSIWKEETRPTTEDFTNFLSLYGNGVKQNLQSANPNNQNYITWTYNMAKDSFDYVISNVSVDDGETFSVEGSSLEYYQKPSSVNQNNATDDEVRIADLVLNLQYETLKIEKKAYGTGAQTDTFVFNVKVGKDKANQNYQGNYQVGKEAAKSTSNGKITGVTAGTTTISQIPKGFKYEVTEDNKNGYTSVLKGSNTGTLNNEATVSYVNIGQTEASVTKVWNDNNREIRPEISMELYYKIGQGNEQKVSAHLKDLGLESMPEVQKTTNSYSNVTYKFSKLPACTTDGEEITYSIKEETDLTEYIQSYVDDKIVNTLKATFTGTINWKDAALDEKTKEEYRNDATITLYYKDKNGKEQIVDTEIVWSGEGDTRTFSFQDLPMYDATGMPYSYYAKETFSNHKYEAVYHNDDVSTGTGITECYSGGSIDNILRDTTSIKVSKTWKDGQDTNSRPTDSFLQLYRYPKGGSISDATVVLTNDNAVTQTVLTTDETYTFGTTEQPIQKYDDNGNEYIYFVKEIVGGNDYIATYENVGDYSDNEKVAFDGGTITNEPKERINFTATKVWETRAKADIVDGWKVVLEVQRRDKDSSNQWESAGETITTNSFLSDNIEIGSSTTIELPKMFNHKKQEYRVVEKYLVKDDKTTLYPSEEKIYTKNMQQEDDSSDYFTSSSEYEIEGNIASSTVTNSIHGITDVGVKKVWPTDGAPHDAEVTIELYLNGNATGKTAVLTADNTNNWTKTMTLADLKDQLNVDTLEKYNEEGDVNVYTFKERGTQPGYFPIYRVNLNDQSKTAVMADNYYVTTITNTKTGGGTDLNLNKTWLDDGNASARGSVVVDVYDHLNGTGNLVQSVTLGESNNWETTVHFNEELDLSKYSIKERSVGGVPLEDDIVTVNNYQFESSVTNITGSDSSYHATVTNKRVGTINIVANKTWIDGGDVTARPTVQVKIDNITDSNNITNVGTYALWNAEMIGSPTNDNTETISLNKYDDVGKLIEYSVSEVVTYLDGQTERDYESSELQTYTEGENHTGDIFTFEYTNKRSGEIDFTAYKKWQNVSKASNNPDIRLKLYTKRNIESSDYEPYAEDYTEKWTTNSDDAAYDWKCEINHLPKYDDLGYRIDYAAQEILGDSIDTYAQPEYYTDTTRSEATQTYVKNHGLIVNSLTGSVVVRGTKTWLNLDSGYDIKTLPNVKVMLQRSNRNHTDELVQAVAQLDESRTGFTIVYKTDDDGNLSSDTLEKYDEYGLAYDYKIVETFATETMENVYDTTINGYALVNAYKTGDDNKKIITVQKNWAGLTNTSLKDNGNLRYPAVTFTLYRYEKGDEASKEKIITKTINGGSEAPSECIFDGLQIYSPKGIQYVYEVEESPINGYTTTPNTQVIDNESATSEVTFTNTYSEDCITLNGKKTWVDYSNSAGVRPENINIVVTRWANAQTNQSNGIASETLVENTDYTVKWTKSGDQWSYEIQGVGGKGIVRYAPNGSLYQYRITENPVNDNYKVSGTANVSTRDADGNITMSEISNTLNGSMNVVKNWEDGTDEYHLRPTEVIFYLQRKTGENEWKFVNITNDTIADTAVEGTTSITLNAVVGNTWRGTFSQLPVTDANGKTYQYRAVEINTSKHAVTSGQVLGTYDAVDYSNKEGTTTLTNKLISTSLTVIKKWEGDQSNQYDTRPTNSSGIPAITVYLQRKTESGENYDYVNDASGNVISRTLSGTGDTLTKTFNNLPANDAAGNPYSYRATEVEPGQTTTPYQSYTMSESTKDSTTTITNTLNNHAVANVLVEKKWEDGQNTHPLVIMKLQYTTVGENAKESDWKDYANQNNITLDGTTDEGIGTEDTGEYDKWKGRWTNVPATDNAGNPFYYRVREVTDLKENYLEPVYSADGSSENTSHDFTVTNTKKTSYKVVKSWDDQNNKYNTRPTSLEFKLQRKLATDGEDKWRDVSEKTYEMDDNWGDYTFTDLPEYDNNNVKYIYRVRETSELKNYKEATYADTNNQTTVTNELSTKDIIVTKTWYDEDSSKRPSSEDALGFTLYQSSGNVLVEVTDAAGQKLTPTWTKQDNQWTCVYSGLPQYETGTQNTINYVVKENGKLADYVITAGTNGVSSGETIDNTQLVSFNVTKKWSDQDNLYKTRPNSITVYLEKKWEDDTTSNAWKQTDKTITIHSEGTSKDTGSFTNLPLYEKDESGAYHKLEYRARENTVNGYTPSYKDDSKRTDGTIRSTEITNTLEEISVSVDNTWVDLDNKYATRPAIDSHEVEFTLYKQTGNTKELVQIDGKNVTGTWEEVDKNTWKCTFNDLPKIDTSGKEFVYVVEETKIPVSYEITAGTQGAKNGETITNTLKTTKLNGTITWIDQDNKYMLRPSDVELEVYQNDQLLVSNPTITVEKDELLSNIWNYTVDDLPAVDGDGNPYVYTICEKNVVDGYQVSYDATNTNIMNTYDQYGGICVENIREAGNVDQTFNFKVELQVPDKDKVIYTGVYKVYDKDADITTAEPLRTVVSEDGTIVLKGGEKFILENIPKNTEYVVSEEVNEEYEMKSSGESGMIVTNEITNVIFTNTAIPMMRINNITNDNAGGLVALLTSNDTKPSEYAQMGYKENILGATWKSFYNWTDSDTIIIKYKEFGSDEEKEITISHILNEDGTLKDATDPVFDELKMRFPDFTITCQNGIYTIIFAKDVLDMPRKLDISVAFTKIPQKQTSNNGNTSTNNTTSTNNNKNSSANANEGQNTKTSKTAKTGDTMPIVFLMAGALLALVGIENFKKKRKE